MKKVFVAFMALATIAMVGCKKNDPVVQPGGGGGEPEIVIPIIDQPGAGFTTIAIYAPLNTTEYGMYAVGAVNGWAEKDAASYRFKKLTGEERWWVVTIPYEASQSGQGLKVLAMPSDTTVLGWSYQWGKNMDPDNELTEDNVIIKQGTGEFVLENQGQPKLISYADNSVIFIQVKAWATSPIIPDEPCATAAIKHPWNGGPDWTYQEMTKLNDTTFVYSARYGNNGCNIALNTSGESEVWYPELNKIGEYTFETGDSVKFEFISRKGTQGIVNLYMIEKGTPTPPAEPQIVTVSFKLPDTWTNTPTAWIWEDGQSGTAVDLTQAGDKWTYTTPSEVTALNIIVRNGADWGGDANQTVDIRATENTCYELASDGASKATYTVVDCE